MLGEAEGKKLKAISQRKNRRICGVRAGVKVVCSVVVASQVEQVGKRTEVKWADVAGAVGLGMG